MLKLTIEPTENPRVMKFVANKPLISGSLDISRESDFSKIPLALELFNYPFVSNIFITANFVAVAKDDSYSWEQIGESLKLIIEDYLIDYPEIIVKKEKDISFVSEITPNPSVVKFITENYLTETILEIESSENTNQFPLAKALFDEFNFVTGIFIQKNQVSITKNQETEWQEVMSDIMIFLADYIKQGKEIVSKNFKNTNPLINNTKEYTETEKSIISILDQYVKPAIEGDGGMISLIEFEEQTKTAKMLLQGACSGCPSSEMTLKSGIQNVLNQFLPGIVDNIESVND